MRILFVANVFRAHVYVQVPLAWALRNAGHEVCLAGPPDLADIIAHTGIPGVVIGEMLNIDDKMTEAMPYYAQMEPADPRGQRTGKSVQSDFGWGDPHLELADLIAGCRSAMFPDSAIEDLLSVARRWRPDLVITDPTSFPGAVAARIVGAAHARLLFAVDRIAQLRAACRARPSSAGDPLRDWLEPFLRRYGHDFDETIVTGHWTIAPEPPWIRQPEGVHYVPMRRVVFNGPSIVPDWVFEPPARRRVCVTLGVTHRDIEITGSVPVREVLDAVADLDVEVIATLNNKQLESVSSVPDNVRTFDFVPLNALLPTCSAIVHDGGGGSFTSALTYAVPQIVLPQDFTIEKWLGPLAIALGVEERGIGLYPANAGHATADLLRDSLKQVLEDPSFAANAARESIAFRAQPSPNDIVPVVEKLTAQYRAA